MNESVHNQEVPQKESRWHRLQRGQAMVEYWPTLPAAIMVMIAASALVGPIGRVFHQTADALNLTVCGDAPPAYFTLPIGQAVEIIGTNYDSDNDRSTFTLSVPGDSRVILGLSEEDVQRIAQATEGYTDYQQDPATGKTGISFDSADDNGIQTSDARQITLTLTGQVDFVNNLEVTVVDGSNQVSSGHIYTTVSYTGEDCVNQSATQSSTQTDTSTDTETKVKSNNSKGNNGVGNGLDDQPPGNPPENDTCDTAAPGSPCNKGGADNSDKNKNK